MLHISADFETTTDINDCRVWAYSCVNIEDFVVEDVGNNIDDFMNYMLSCGNSKFYFHNLKFDGMFILSWLFENGFKHTEDKGTPYTFKTLITDNGVFYQIDIFWKMDKKGKRPIHTTIIDSLKKIPLPVNVIPKAFGLEESKLEIDYKAKREIGHKLTQQETDYVIADTMIVAKALHQQLSEGLTSITMPSDAMKYFKTTIGKKVFEKNFPILNLKDDNFIRESYKGGYTYANPKFTHQHHRGMTFDVNSLYPSRMQFEYLPFGYPLRFDGKYEPDPIYPLYIVEVNVEFKIKPNHIPTIQLRNNSAFIQAEYQTSSKGEIVRLVMTNVDLELMFEHYDILYIDYQGGYKFKSAKGIFEDYINHFMHIKEVSEGGKRQIAKLFLNSLYGKFCTNPRKQQNIPYLDDEGVVRFKKSKEVFEEPVYTAMGSFITAYARRYTIQACQKNYDRFMYADTDSMHLEGFEPPIGIEIHPTKLGMWNHESTFIDSKFIRAKTYMELVLGKKRVDEDGNEYYCSNELKWDIKCAGLPERGKEEVTWDNFREGVKYGGKLKPKTVKGGVVLIDDYFTMRGKKDLTEFEHSDILKE